LQPSAAFRVLTIQAVILCFLAVPRIAFAEWHITPMIGFTFAGKTTLIDPQVATGKRHANYGGALTLLGGGILGAETIVVLTPGFFQTDRTALDTDVPPPAITSSRTLAMMGNLVLTTPRRWTEYTLRPFVSGGFGLLRAAKTEQDEVFPLHANFAGFNVGGGAVGFFSQHTGVRFDLRYYGTVHDTDHVPLVAIGDGTVRLRYYTASVGLVIRR
jgi:hypothetical protein